MPRSRTFAYATVAVILAVTLVSGPLVRGVDFTRAASEPATFGEGDATVEVISVPERARLVRGSYGSGSYYLEVPDATVRLTDVTGRPLLAYKIWLPSAGYSRATTHFLSAEQTGAYAVSLQRDAWVPSEVTMDRYEGELVLVLRDGSGERTLYRGNVTVEVMG